jgi:hypothetical protein
MVHSNFYIGVLKYDDLSIKDNPHKRLMYLIVFKCFNSLHIYKFYLNIIADFNILPGKFLQGK